MRQTPLPARAMRILAGGQSPPASARPAPGGRFLPAGSGAGLRRARTCRSAGDRRARAGETRCVSRSHPERREYFHRVNGKGHRLCHSAPSPLVPPGGPKPPASARPAPGGRWPLIFPDLPVHEAPSRAGGASAVRFRILSERAIAVPGSGRLSRQADGRGAGSAPRQGTSDLRRVTGTGGSARFRDGQVRPCGGARRWSWHRAERRLSRRATAVAALGPCAIRRGFVRQAVIRPICSSFRNT